MQKARIRGGVKPPQSPHAQSRALGAANQLRGVGWGTMFVGSLSLTLAATGLAPLAGPAQGGSIVTLPLPAGCVAARCAFGADNSSTASLNSDGDVICAAPPALHAGVAMSMLEGEALGSASLFGVSQLDGDIVRLTRTGATILGTGAISHENVGTLAVPPPLTNSSVSSAVRLSFELLVGRGTGGRGFSISFAPVPRGMHVNERGVASALSISFERCATHQSPRDPPPPRLRPTSHCHVCAVDHHELAPATHQAAPRNRHAAH